jgi:DNA-binding response OmpR family regulator
MEKIKVLVVEDEEAIRQGLLEEFTAEGFDIQGLPNGDLFIKSLSEFAPDVVILDEMMPGKRGRELVTQMRENNQFNKIAVMMLTGVVGENEKISALESGADDYVTKPFSVREVLARTRALSRRSVVQKSAAVPSQASLSFGPIKVDVKSYRAWNNDQEVSLTLTEFKILAELLNQSGLVLTRDNLREKALSNLNVTDRTIDVHMASLRKKLGSSGDLIETVRGVGYRLVTAQ